MLSIDFVLAVGEICWHLVLLNGGKVLINARKVPRCNVVGADGARDCIVVEVCTRILLDVLDPRTAAICCFVVLKPCQVRGKNSRRGRPTTGSTQPTGGAEPLFEMK